MSCSTVCALYLNNDIPLILSDLYNPEISNDLITDASVIVSIEDDDGNAVGTNVVLVWNADQQHYFGVADASTPFVLGEEYTFIFTVTSGAGDLEMRQTLTAEYRQI